MAGFKSFLKKIFGKKEKKSNHMIFIFDELHTPEAHIDVESMKEETAIDEPVVCGKRESYIKEFAFNCSFKVGTAMARGYHSTRALVDMVALEGDTKGVREAVFEQSPYVRNVTFRKIDDKDYAILHIAHDNIEGYMTRSHYNEIHNSSAN